MNKEHNKVTIHTLNGYYNYGNRLQLFALSKILYEHGINANVYWPKTIKKNNKRNNKTLHSVEPSI